MALCNKQKMIMTLLNMFGKNYIPDPHIPISHIIYIILSRMMDLLRGLIFVRSKIFLGRHATIEGKDNIIFGQYGTIDAYVSINAIARHKVLIGKSVRIGAFSRILCTAHLSKVGAGFTIGDHSGCGEYCFFGAAGGITIGKHVIMGQYVSMHAQNHSYDDINTLIQHQPTTEQGIIIGDDCWIGAKATILDGTQIGNHCVVAAGAVVKGTFPDNVVIGGVPAKIIKYIGQHD